MQLQYRTQNRCRKFQSTQIDLTPEIYGLSTYSTHYKDFTTVYITGKNFFMNGTTCVNFGSYQRIPVNFYSSFNLSFVVPINAVPGDYQINVTTFLYPTTATSNTLNFTIEP